MVEIIGLATDAPEQDLPAIRETLHRVLKISPQEPTVGNWRWYGMLTAAQVKAISAAHPEHTFWAEWDLDSGECCVGQYEAYGGEIRHEATLTGEDDDDEPIFEMSQTIGSAKYDRSLVKRLPSDRPYCVSKRWESWGDDVIDFS